MRADLHTHSELSDGFFSIKDLIDYGKKIGLDYIAITDHDTVAGLVTAMTYGKMIGMNIIPGVEFSTRDYTNGRPVHILCYYPGNLLAFQEFLDPVLQIRYEKKMETIAMLEKDFPIKAEEIVAAARKSESLYDPHIMIPFQQMGFTAALVSDFHRENISSKSPRYKTIPYPDVYDALDLIEKHGGIPVLAHPGEYNTLELAEKLAKEGRIKGIEYNHPRNTEADKKEILRIANTYDLFMTGGTDFHGPYTKSVNPLGTCLCPEDGLEKLLAYQKKESRE